MGKEKRLVYKMLDREKLNLAIFLTGKSISLFGSAVYTFAMGVYLLRTTGSGLSFATNIILYTLPIVFINPIAGVIADKINRKLVVIGSDLVNGIFLIVIYLLANKIGISTLLIYISTFFITVFATFFNIGIEAAKPNLVTKEKLVDINSLARVIESGSYVIGPIFGGIIYALFDMKLFILINALSFLISAALEIFIDFNYRTNSQGVLVEQNNGKLGEILKKSFWLELKEGYSYIFARSHMQALVYIFIALNFFFNYTIIVPLPYLLNSVWRVNSLIYGIVEGGFPVGMIIGALLVRKLMARISYSRFLKRISYSIGLGVLAFGLPLLFHTDSPSQVFILCYYTGLMLVIGLIVSWVDIPLNILLQQIVPSEILGRVTSVKLSIIKIIVPIALILSGYLLNVITPLFIFISGSVIFIIFNLWFYTSALGRKFIKISNTSLINDQNIK